MPKNAKRTDQSSSNLTVNDKTNRGDNEHPREIPRKSLIVSPSKKNRLDTSMRKNRPGEKADKGSDGYSSTTTCDQ